MDVPMQNGQNKYTADPEALAQMGQNDGSKIGPAFITPGIPSAPLVGEKDLMPSQISGPATDGLRSALTQQSGS